ncbi:low-density lipoprotein receptor, putative, partial [Ixodes scapularis]
RVSSTEVPLTTLDSGTSSTDTTPTKTAPIVESTTSEATSESVSTTSAEPRTPPVLACRPGEFNCRDGEHCIPSALLCDGVKDCPNGLDEKCGALNQCEQSSVFCPSGSPDRCIGRDLLCNGRVDCTDGSDESLCGNCPASFCLNGGHCDVVNDGRPTCTCPDGASGERCQNIARGSADLQQHSTSSTGWAIAVPVLLILVGVAIIGFLYQRRRKAMRRSPPLILNNPSYDTSFSET